MEGPLHLKGLLLLKTIVKLVDVLRSVGFLVRESEGKELLVVIRA